MRPTLLQFRSPKERTPDPYDTSVTPDGRNILFRSPKGKSRGTSLPLERRFRYYDDEFRKTGFMIGPGSYNIGNLNIENSKLPKGCLYKPFHNNRDASNNAYYMVGDLLLYDGMLKNRQSKCSDIEDRIDVNLSVKSKSPFTSKEKTPTATFSQSTRDDLSATKTSPLNQSLNERGSPWRYLLESPTKSPVNKPRRSKRKMSRKPDSANLIQQLLSERFSI